MAGMAGILWIFVITFFGREGEPGWGALLPAFAFTVLYCIPLTAGLVISWRRPFMGGITMIAIASVVMAIALYGFLVKPATNPVSELLIYSGITFATFGLPYLIPGILFLLSSEWRSVTRQPTNQEK